MLKGKPRVGEILVENGRRFRVDHFGSDPGICFVVSLDSRPEHWGKDVGLTCFIWRFGDGTLNQAFSHEPWIGATANATAEERMQAYVQTAKWRGRM